MLLSLALALVCGATPLSTDLERRADPLRPLVLQVSLLPPLSVNALFDYRTRNALALDLLVGNAGALSGVQLSGLGARNGDLRGLHVAGITSWVDAGAFGQDGTVRGAQVSGILNWAGGRLAGTQVAGAVNVAGADSAGVQLAGAANVAAGFKGLQIAGLVNVAGGDAGLQISGAVNVAGQAAAQLGIVNVADDADVAVGVFSWVTRGRHDVTTGVTEYGPLLQADTGGRIVYGLLAGGSTFTSPRRYLLGLGVGWRAVSSDAFAVDVQGLGMQMVDPDAWAQRWLASARVLLAARVAGPLSVFAGPTLNVLVDREPEKVALVGYGWRAGSGVLVWPGFMAGVRLL